MHFNILYKKKISIYLEKLVLLISKNFYSHIASM